MACVEADLAHLDGHLRLLAEAMCYEPAEEVELLRGTVAFHLLALRLFALRDRGAQLCQRSAGRQPRDSQLLGGADGVQPGHELRRGVAKHAPVLLHVFLLVEQRRPVRQCARTSERRRLPHAPSPPVAHVCMTPGGTQSGPEGSCQSCGGGGRQCDSRSGELRCGPAGVGGCTAPRAGGQAPRGCCGQHCGRQTSGVVRGRPSKDRG
mmetsp:Transcript_41207/g.128463  ORF Transcript_41207/g.128463 Transcript_41207/m.128463 type:complete len:208 (-) Transcript_41207:28-651(-)